MKNHACIQTETGWRCEVCERTWKRLPTSDCPGVKVYSWGQWPEHLKTKKQLNDAGFQTGKKLPSPAGAVYRSKSPSGFMWLYDANAAVPKQAPTEAQKAALEKARYMSEKIDLYCPDCGRWVAHLPRKKAEKRPGRVCERCQDETEAVHWAQLTLKRTDVLILDTETTDLDGEIIQIAIIDLEGNELFNSLVQPTEAVSDGARDVHGITDEQLATAPRFTAIYPRLAELFVGKLVLTYNAAFDRARLWYTCKKYGLSPLVADWQQWDCIMEWYAQWFNEWSNYHQSYKWQRLHGGHDALGDCRAALARLREMAGTNEREERVSALLSQRFPPGSAAPDTEDVARAYEDVDTGMDLDLPLVPDVEMPDIDEPDPPF